MNTNPMYNDFISEAVEHLAHVEDDILTIEKAGKNFDPETMNRLFRAMHSVKGASSFLNLANISRLSHSLENVVDQIRKGQIIPGTAVTETLLRGVDKLKQLVNNIENEAAAVIAKEVSDLEQISTSPRLEQPAEKPTTRVTLSQESFEETKVTKREIKSISIEQQEIPARRYIYACQMDLIEQNDKKGRLPAAVFKNLMVLGTIIDAHLNTDTIGDLSQNQDESLLLDFRISTVIEDKDILAEALDIHPQKISLLGQEATEDIFAIEEATQLPAAESTAAESTSEIAVTTTSPTLPVLPAAESPNKPPETTSLRISIGLLDTLMNLASELVLVRNQNMQAAGSGDLALIRSTARKLNLVTSELQANILKTRMQVMDVVFSKFARVVRDLSKRLEKEINLVIIGKDVELDKSIIEALNDPLNHIIRNCVDHGIELPADREKSGKPAAGKISMAAYYKEGQVNIKIEDDGRGMDAQQLIATAVRKGILTPAQAQDYSEKDAIDLIFKPGFSTLQSVTDLSGRGVGMDVVKTNIQKLGGTIHVDSRPGKGTIIDLRLPLTLSIMQALIVVVEEIRFAIPEYNIAEVIQLYGEDTYSKIRNVDETEFYQLRGRLIPIIRLHKVLKIEKTFRDPVTGAPRKDCREHNDDGTVPALQQRRTSVANSLYIMILKLGNLLYGLAVDSIVDTEEIVIKPLHDHVKKCRAFIGTTVLGDGRIALLLDIGNLAELAAFNRSKIEHREEAKKAQTEDTQSVLVFSIGGEESFAIPLLLISHIEKISRKQIMLANKKEYLKFQNRVIRLVRLEYAIDQINTSYGDDLYIIIIKARKPIGIVVSSITDNITIDSSIDTEHFVKPGIIGGIILNKSLTLILDVFSIIEQIEPSFIIAPAVQDVTAKKILLVEDSKFYISLIMSYLASTGMKVVLARNGKEGLACLQEEAFDYILSDLEMPVMDGFEFARQVRKNPAYASLTMIAISSVYSREKGEEIALTAGFNRYLSKLDKEGLIEGLLKISKHTLRPAGRN